eukprot:4233148-Alexandrium_andersonii.AAC.1
MHAVRLPMRCWCRVPLACCFWAPSVCVRVRIPLTWFLGSFTCRRPALAARSPLEGGVQDGRRAFTQTD